MEKIMLAKLAWNQKKWKGWDHEGYDNRDNYNYRFVKDHGLAYEWWNFYDFDDEYYYGHIEMGRKTPRRFEDGGLIIFVSYNIYDGEFYAIGFYGKAESDDYIQERTRWETIGKIYQDKIIKDIRDGKITSEIKDDDLKDKIFFWRGKKEYSTVFEIPIKFDVDEFGIKHWGSPTIIYVDNKVKLDTTERLLLQTLEKHKELLDDVEDSNKFEVQSIVDKIEEVLDVYIRPELLHYKPNVFLIQKSGDKPAKHNVKTFPDRSYAEEALEYGYYRNDSWDVDKKAQDFENVNLHDYILVYCTGDVEGCPQQIKYIYEVIAKEKLPEIEIQNAIKDGIISEDEAERLRSKDHILRLELLHELQRGLELRSIKDWVKEAKLSEKMNKCGERGFNICQVSYEDYETIINWDTQFIEESFRNLRRILHTKNQVILYGPPGTGKTYIAREFVKKTTQGKYESKEFVTFHQSYAYEDFIEGLKPKTDEEGKIRYDVEDGIFKRTCITAFNALLTHCGLKIRWERDRNLPKLNLGDKKIVLNELKSGDYPRFYLIIDEINRGDISRIFGELITLLEADKRLFSENELIATLPYSKKKFGIPPNIYIIGTMNTADRSIALIDVALRRRFGFIELMPDYEVLLDELLGEKADNIKEVIESWEFAGFEDQDDIKKLAIKVIYRLNEKILSIYDRDHQIGHSYVVKLKDSGSKDEAVKLLREIWFYEIIPLLQEYFYDRADKLATLLGNSFFKQVDKSYEFSNFDDYSDEEFLNALWQLASGA